MTKMLNMNIEEMLFAEVPDVFVEAHKIDNVLRRITFDDFHATLHQAAQEAAEILMTRRQHMLDFFIGYSGNLEFDIPDFDRDPDIAFVRICFMRDRVTVMRQPSIDELRQHCILDICDAAYTDGDMIGIYDLPGAKFHHFVIKREIFGLIA
ncbi:hypothetical protein [Loktanella salsilacus]|nr:hypothetical protein [Loktanella salsilacus]